MKESAAFAADSSQKGFGKKRGRANILEKGVRQCLNPFCFYLTGGV